MPLVKHDQITLTIPELMRLVVIAADRGKHGLPISDIGSAARNWGKKHLMALVTLWELGELERDRE